MSIIYSLDGVTRHKVKSIYLGIQDKARKIKKVYVGINNQAKLVWSALSRIIIGSSLPQQSVGTDLGEALNHIEGLNASINKNGMTYFDSNLYATSGKIVYKSDDGESWNTIGNIPLDSGSIDNNGTSLISYSDSSSNIYSSVDGITWTSKHVLNGTCTNMHIDNKTKKILYGSKLQLKNTVTCPTCSGTGKTTCNGSFQYVTSTKQSIPMPCPSCGMYTFMFQPQVTTYQCNSCNASYFNVQATYAQSCPYCGKSCSSPSGIIGSKTHNQKTCSSCSGNGTIVTETTNYYAQLYESIEHPNCQVSLPMSHKVVASTSLNGEMFVADGYSSIYIISERDGNYHTATIYNTGIVALCSNNKNTLVAISKNGATYYSNDFGYTWLSGTSIQPTSSTYFDDITVKYDDDTGLFFATVTYGNSYYLYVSNGIQWGLGGTSSGQAQSLVLTTCK